MTVITFNDRRLARYGISVQLKEKNISVANCGQEVLTEKNDRKLL